MGECQNAWSLIASADGLLETSLPRVANKLGTAATYKDTTRAYSRVLDVADGGTASACGTCEYVWNTPGWRRD